MAIKVLELFSGIGATSKALSNIGIDYVLVDAVEIDQYAVNSFNAVHGTSFKPQDIREWDKDIDVDLLVHGSPCQDFSIAGLGAGGDKGSGTRSSLMYETLRIVHKLRPKYVVWENVKGLLSKKHIHNFDAYLIHMSTLGYKSMFKVLNAKDFGIPQNRERVFTVSVYMPDDIGFEKDLQGLGIFNFPAPITLKKTWKDILEDDVDGQFYLPYEKYKNVKFKAITNKKQQCKPVRVGGLYDKPGDKFKTHQAGSIYDLTGICPTLSTMQGGNREPIIVESWSPMKVRKITPKECWRLMGFSDDDFLKAKKVNSNSQLYKQAGNSICVPVIEAILRRLLNGS